MDRAQTEVEAVADLMRQEGRLVNIGGEDKFAVVHGDTHAVDLEKYRDAPSRVKASPRFADEASFLAYVDRMKAERSTIYANFERGDHGERSQYMLQLVVDHHGASAPSWEDHGAWHEKKFSPEFIAWLGADQRRLAQRDAADFIDERIADIVTPIAIDLLALVENFRATKMVSVVSEERRTSGDVVFHFDSTTTPAVAVPEKLELSVPIFEGDPVKEEVTIRFGYRLDDKHPEFIFHLERRDEVIRDAFMNAVERVRKASGLPVYLGRP